MFGDRKIDCESGNVDRRKMRKRPVSTGKFKFLRVVQVLEQMIEIEFARMLRRGARNDMC